MVVSDGDDVVYLVQDEQCELLIMCCRVFFDLKSIGRLSLRRVGHRSYFAPNIFFSFVVHKDAGCCDEALCCCDIRLGGGLMEIPGKYLHLFHLFLSD